VEDDAAVRALCRTVLDRHGYRVIEAAGPSEALAIAATLEEPVDLVLTDIVMPGMSGPQMVGELLATHPHRPILYMSGYSEEAIAQQRLLDRTSELLEKPFSAVALLSKVRQLLDSAR